MNDLYIYLLKVSAGLGIIALPYYFLFRNDPNLSLKRYYLALGLVVAWIVPLIAFHRPELLLNLTPTVFMDPVAGDRMPVTLSASGSGAGITINWIRILFMVYLSGVAFMVIKNLAIILKWNMTWKYSRTGEGFAFTQSDQVFTIFTRIFVPGSLRDKKDLDNILLHEKAHVRQLHFIDLTLMEITLLLTWFNPFSWLISRMIKENHEHLADRQVLSSGVNPARYRAQLLNHTLGVNVFRLGNQFNHSITLKRFKMMKKPRRSLMGIIKIALLVPAILFTLGLATGMTPQQQKTIKGKVVFAEDGDPAIGAAVIIAGTTVGAVTDTDGKFMLNVEGDPEIVISFVGFATLRTKASGIGKNPLKLEQETYTLDLGSADPAPEKGISGSISMVLTDDPETAPVFVLDGEVVTEINDLDPGTIEHIEVFKDPESEVVKKYNAKEGVILITTREKVPTEVQTEEELLKAGDEVFYVVEDMPKFPGGTAALRTYIYSRLEFPEEMKNKGVSGEVYVQFMVPPSGKLEDISVARSSHKEFEAPALEVFKGMPNWSPGKQRGKPVKVRVVVPVRFSEK